MRRIGSVSAVALAICLGAIGLATAGGPQAPFTQWAAPHAPAAVRNDVTARGTAPGRGVASPTLPGPQRGSALPPSPTPTAAPSGSPTTPQPTTSSMVTAGGSATSPATNPAGRTPPGQTKSPHPGNGTHGA
jgi:hypothetical protein